MSDNPEYDRHQEARAKIDLTIRGMCQESYRAGLTVGRCSVQRIFKWLQLDGAPKEGWEAYIQELRRRVVGELDQF